jgi:hypothetical protein
VSCPSITFCVAKDEAGNVLTGTPAPPRVTKVSPTKGPASGGTSVKITGANFEAVSSVHFDSGEAASFKVISPTSITAVTPAAGSGAVDVTVSTPAGTSAIAASDRFSFLPTVSGLSPSSGPTVGATSVKLTGAGFALGTTATTIKFGTAKASAVSCPSSTECMVVAPRHVAGSVDVKATVGTLASPKTPADVYTYS